MRKKRNLFLVGLLIFAVLTLGACTKHYQASFYADGVLIDTVEITNGVVNPPFPVFKAGHRFSGWFLDEGVWERPFFADTPKYMDLKGDIAVYAKWQKIEYCTVTYSVGGEVFETQQAERGEKLKITDKIPSSGDPDQEFFNWYTDETLESVFRNETVVDDDLTLYAGFFQNPYYFNDYNGTNTYYVSAVKSKNDLTNAVIPNVYRGKAVYGIMNNVFSECASLESVEISAGIAEIGSSAFRGCRLLTRAVIPKSVLSVGNEAFGNCESLIIYAESPSVPSQWNDLWNPDSRPVVWDCLKNDVADDGCAYTVSNGILYALKGGKAAVARQSTNAEELGIAPQIFYRGQTFEVNEILDSAFADSPNLLSVTIPDSVTTIGFGVFRNCYKLKSVTLPFVGENADGTGNGYFAHIFGNGAAENVFEVPISLQTVVLTGSAAIRNEAFRGCNRLTRVEIPLGVKSVGEKVFPESPYLTVAAEAERKPSGWSDRWNYFNRPVVWDCRNNDLADDGAFYVFRDDIRYALKDGSATLLRQRGDVTDLEIPYEISYRGRSYPVTEIVSYAFDSCVDLKRVAIPASVSKIGNEIFCSISRVETITIAEGNAKYFASGNCIVERDSKILTIGVSSSTIPTDGSVTAIGNHAFANCYYLYQMPIPSCVVRIENYAFRFCENLERVELFEGLTTIGEFAFDSCVNLREIRIPASVTSVGSNAFDGTGIWNAAGDGEIVYAGNWAVGYKTTLSVGSAAVKVGTVGIADRAFYRREALTNVSIPDSVTKIGAEVFQGCRFLTEVVIGNGVKEISSEMFYSLENLSNVVVGNGVVKIGDSAFSHCKNLLTVRIGAGVTDIGASAFYGCTKLENAVFGGGVLRVGDRAFFGCAGLKNVEFPESLTVIGKDAFHGAGLTRVTVPSKTTEIGDSAFAFCSDLTEVRLPEGLLRIGDSAFYRCSALTSIAIPNGVKEIGNETFFQCWELKTATLPETLTRVGDSAFQYCSALLEIAVPSSVASIGISAFEGCINLQSAAVGDGVTSLAKNVFYECYSLTRVSLGSGLESMGDWAFLRCAVLAEFEFSGTKAQWKSIVKTDGWNSGTTDYIVKCADGTLTKAERDA